MYEKKMFANDALNKELILQIFKELMQLNNKQAKPKNYNSLNKKWAEKLKRYFFLKETMKWPTGTGKDAQHY